MAVRGQVGRDKSRPYGIRGYECVGAYSVRPHLMERMRKYAEN